MITGTIVYNDKSVDLKDDLLNYFKFVEFKTLNEDLFKDKRKAIIAKSSCGAKISPFVSFHEDGKLIKAFYSDTGECTLDLIAKYLYEYCIDKSISGEIYIAKISDNYNETVSKGDSILGFVNNFGLGLPCIVNNANYFIKTTPIIEINEKEGFFKTRNSTYLFKFDYKVDKKILKDENKTD